MLVVKPPACQWRRYKRHMFDPWVGKTPWRRKWQLCSVWSVSSPLYPPAKRFLANMLLSWIWLGSRNLMTTKTIYEDSAVPGLKGSWSSKSLGASHRVAQPQVLKSDLSDSTPVFSPITYSLFSSSTCQTISSPRSREGWNFKYFKTICINALNKQ